jgi:hypothetical protein
MNQTRTDSNIADKILKLLTLAGDDGATEAEAQNAKAKARKLLEKYNLTRSDLTTSQIEVRTWDHHYTRPPGWYKMIAGQVTHIMGVFAVSKGDTYSLAGRPADIDQATYMIDQLRTQVMTLSRAWGQRQKEATGRTPSRRDYNSYRVGLAGGIQNRLEGLIAGATHRRAGEEGLVRKAIESRRRDAETAWRRAHPDVRLRSTSVEYSGTGRRAGQQDAGKVNLSRGVGNGRGGRRKSLGA